MKRKKVHAEPTHYTQKAGDLKINNMKALTNLMFTVTILHTDAGYWWSAINKESGVESFIMEGLASSPLLAQQNFKGFANLNGIKEYAFSSQDLSIKNNFLKVR